MAVLSRLRTTFLILVAELLTLAYSPVAGGGVAAAATLALPVPSGLSIQCLVCSPVAVTNSQAPLMQARLADPNHLEPELVVEIWTRPAIGVATSVGRLSLSFTAWKNGVSTYGGVLNVADGLLNGGAYQVRARSVEAISADSTRSSAWSAMLPFRVSATPPPAPVITLTPASGYVVGKPITVTVAPAAASDDVDGYQLGNRYGVFADVTAPRYCGSKPVSATVYGPCAIPGQPVTLTWVPTDEDLPNNNNVSVEAVSRSGLVGRSFEPIIVGPDVSAVADAHSWKTSGPLVAGAFADSAATSSTAATAAKAQPLVLHAGATTATLPFFSLGSFHFTIGAIGFDAQGSATTAREVADTSKSFTVGAWLEPTALGAAVAVSQAATNGEGFTLGMDAAGDASFCMATLVGAGTPMDCVKTIGLPLNQWTFLWGIWDAAAHQIRTNFDSRGLVCLDDCTASASHQIWVGAHGPLKVGGASSGLPWTGYIANPAIFPGVLDHQQLRAYSG